MVQSEDRSITPTPFIILFLERSGSSFLVSLLNSHPDVYCRYEDFATVGPNHIVRRLHSFHDGTIENPDIGQIQEHLFWIFNRPAKASGFKLKFPYQYNRYPEVLRVLLARRSNLKVLCLDRSDIVKRMISLQHLEIVRESESLVSANRVDSRTTKPFVVDIPRLLDMAVLESHRRSEMISIAGLFPNCLTVNYDELLHSPESTMLQITEFLKVSPLPALVSQFKKVTPDELSGVVANVTELEQALAQAHLSGEFPWLPSEADSASRHAA